MPDPLIQKLESVLDRQDQARDDLAASQAPMGRYSQPKLDVLVAAVNKMLALIGANIQVQPQQSSINKAIPLSVDLVKALLLIKNMIADYNYEGNEIRSYEVAQAKTDEDLAIITRVINSLLSDRDFKKWLLAEREEPEGMETKPEDETVEAPGQKITSSPVKNVDLLALK